ncbi:MAG: hypothetical protein NTX50_03050 [Candidatus Sumerlaeota bacterium]|nr:hypothetical protein [Candidatus Sumerlaeota bacterium]
MNVALGGISMTAAFAGIIFFGIAVALLALPIVLIAICVGYLGKSNTRSMEHDRIYQEACQRLATLSQRIENLETILIKQSGNT